jgi:hypothetical protein
MSNSPALAGEPLSDIFTEKMSGEGESWHLDNKRTVNKGGIESQGISQIEN